MSSESEKMNLGSENVAMLGELFYRSGLVSIDQLCHALYVAHKNSLPLGRVLVMLGMTKTRILEGALTLQNLVRQNLLTPALAVHCLQILGTNKVRVEEVLSEMGWEGNPHKDEGNVGEILVEAKILTRKSIDDALGLSRHIGLPLPRILYLQGMVSSKLLNATMKCQDVIRSGRVQKEEAIQALASVASMLEFEKACENALETKQPFIKLEELLLLARLLSQRDLQNFEEQMRIVGVKNLGQYIVECGFFSSTLIASAVRLQSMIARFELTPLSAAGALRLIFSRNLSLADALEEIGKERPPYDGEISLYHLLRLSGLVTAFDVRRLGHLPGTAGQQLTDPIEERLFKAGILSKASIDAAKRCQLLIKEGFLTAEQALIVLQHWSWSGEGLTRVLEKLHWGPGNMPTLHAQAFRS
ncbi:MAG: hypothetical protein SFV17_02605 [Candidatus Obscuribacter sp.]|nr:hypothetical protein [Candidatus Melainabacteria bacterium]MDX1985553.1 hypothetical protein [Candidatus Obscuribacter sp.]